MKDLPDSALDSVLDSVLVRGELWRSLVSQLHVYANAAMLHYGEHSLRETSVEEVVLRYQDAVLEISFRSGTGEGSWRLHRSGGSLAEGAFDISDQGILRVAAQNGGNRESRLEMELDEAAFEWVRRLGEAAGATPIREAEMRDEKAWGAAGQ